MLVGPGAQVDPPSECGAEPRSFRATQEDSMQKQVFVVRRGKRKQALGRLSLTAHAPHLKAPATIAVSIQLGTALGWTRLLTTASADEFVAALAPDLSHLSENLWGGA